MQNIFKQVCFFEYYSYSTKYANVSNLVNRSNAELGQKVKEVAFENLKVTKSQEVSTSTPLSAFKKVKSNGLNYCQSKVEFSLTY